MFIRTSFNNPNLTTLWRFSYPTRPFSTFKGSSQLYYAPFSPTLSPDIALQSFINADQSLIVVPQLSMLRNEKTISAYKTRFPVKPYYVPFYAINVQVKATAFATVLTKKEPLSSEYQPSNPDPVKPLQNGQVFTYLGDDTINTDGTVTKHYLLLDKLGKHEYTPQDGGMSLYGGFKWAPFSIEGALKGINFATMLKPYKLEKISTKTVIDPFLKYSSAAKEIAAKRIEAEEQKRVHNYLLGKYPGFTPLRNTSYVDADYDYSFTTFMAPFYILEQDSASPRFLLAHRDKNAVYGPSPISSLKSGLGAVADVIDGFRLRPTIRSGISFFKASMEMRRENKEELENYKKSEKVVRILEFLEHEKFKPTAEDEERVSQTMRGYIDFAKGKSFK
jgi:hypothetical protein